MDNKQNKESQPLMVSIRCLAYNHEKFIRETLEGFVMQKTNFRFEAIVHDDASTDGTAEIIREYAEKYPDIIKPIYETENQYSKKDGSLFRITHEACKGKYIAFCEGDDYWTDPYKLQKQVDFLETHPDFVMCSHVFKTYKEDSKIFELGLDVKEDVVYDFDSYVSRNYWYTQPLTCIYKSSAFHLNEYLKYKYSKDVTLFYHLLKKGKGLCMKDCMAVYRVHKGGIWAGLSMEERLLADLNTLKGIYDVDLNIDAAMALRSYFMRFCDKFTYSFILKNRLFLFSIWKVLFKYFGFSSIPLFLHLLHLKQYIFLWKRCKTHK